mmetsp:Transcript_40789/g.108073  ORF Transcript_40789/g.108073 Transcript_40789/m.108073 type:complete len:205 (-) Transcript_40789:396-1010(-)
MHPHEVREHGAALVRCCPKYEQNVRRQVQPLCQMFTTFLAHSGRLHLETTPWKGSSRKNCCWPSTSESCTADDPPGSLAVSEYSPESKLSRSPAVVQASGYIERSDMAASEESELSCSEQYSGLCVEAVVVTFACASTASRSESSSSSLNIHKGVRSEPVSTRFNGEEDAWLAEPSLSSLSATATYRACRRWDVSLQFKDTEKM